MSKKGTIMSSRTPEELKKLRKLIKGVKFEVKEGLEKDFKEFAIREFCVFANLFGRILQARGIISFVEYDEKQKWVITAAIHDAFDLCPPFPELSSWKIGWIMAEMLKQVMLPYWKYSDDGFKKFYEGMEEEQALRGRIAILNRWGD